MLLKSIIGIQYLLLPGKNQSLQSNNVFLTLRPSYNVFTGRPRERDSQRISRFSSVWSQQQTRVPIAESTMITARTLLSSSGKNFRSNPHLFYQRENGTGYSWVRSNVNIIFGGQPNTGKKKRIEIRT